MTFVKWAILPVTVFTVFVVMYSQAAEDTKKGPKVTDIVSHTPTYNYCLHILTI